MTDTTTPKASKAKQPAEPKTDTAPAATTKPEPTVTTAVSIELPKPTRSGGKTSPFKFESLEIGQAFGVTGRTKRDMAGKVSNANRKYKNEMKDANGTVINTVQERHFYAVEVTDDVRARIAGTALEGSDVLVYRDA